MCKNKDVLRLRPVFGLLLCVSMVVSPYIYAVPEATHAVLLIEAETLYTAGRFDQALEKYTVFLERAGFAAATEKVLYRMALLGLKTGAPRLFLRYASQLSLWFPDSAYNSELRTLQWQAHAMDGDFLSAAQSLQTALSTLTYSEEREARLRVYLADLYQRAYRPEEAVEQYIVVLRLQAADDDASRALYRLAEWFDGRGERELALEYVSRLLRKYPGTVFQSRAKALERRLAWTYMTEQSGLPSNAVSSIAFDGDDIWVGTWLGGLMRYTRSSGRSVIFNTRNSRLASNLIRDIAVTAHRVWVATFDGLMYYDKVLSEWNTIQSVDGVTQQLVKSLVLDDGKLWVSTLGRGIAVLDFRTGSWITYNRSQGLPENNVVALCPTPASIWAGTIRGGVARMDKRSGRWTVYRQSSVTALRSDNIRAIAFDGVRVWIATHGGGISSCYEDGSDWVQYAKANSGLQSDYIFSLAVAPSGEIWAGTLGGGVSIYNPATKIWRSMSVRDGLPGNEITALAFEGRHVWFGTLNGGLGIYRMNGGTHGRTGTP